MTARGIQAVREHLAKLPPSSSLTLAERRAQYDRAERVFPTPADVTVETAQAPERAAEWLTPPGAGGDAAVLYFHGGGHAPGSPPPSARRRRARGRHAGAAGRLPPGAGASLPGRAGGRRRGLRVAAGARHRARAHRPRRRLRRRRPYGRNAPRAARPGHADAGGR